MKSVFIVATIAVAISGCARTNVMQTSASTVQISARAAPVCGAEGAQRLAFRRAAVETIRQGFDGFVIFNGTYQNEMRVVGTTPVTANTYGSATAYGNMAYGSATTYYSGGQPIFAGGHNQNLQVKMFHAGEPGAEQAIDARTTLGPEWQKLVADDASLTTCVEGDG